MTPYELEQKLEPITSRLDEILNGQIQRTRFFTLRVPARTNVKGIPLGRGGCRGIVAQLNQGVLGAPATAAADQLRFCYIGDADNQAWQISEATRTTIPCRDLEEVWVRNGFAAAGVTQYLQIQVFLGRDDQIEINPDLL